MKPKAACEKELAELAPKIEAAKFSVRSRELSVNRAQSAYDKANEKLGELITARDSLLIELWGDQPDWSLLLDENASLLFYTYGNDLLKEMGLHAYMANSKTRQRGLWISFDSGSSKELDKVYAGLERLEPYLKADNRGYKVCGVRHSRFEEYALELEFTELQDSAGLAKYVYAREETEDRLTFGNVREALLYIQQDISVYEEESDDMAC